LRVGVAAVVVVMRIFLATSILTTPIVPARGLVGGLSGLCWGVEAQMGRFRGKRMHSDPVVRRTRGWSLSKLSDNVQLDRYVRLDLSIEKGLIYHGRDGCAENAPTTVQICKFV